MTDFEDAKVAIQLQIEAKNYERMENGMDYQEQMQREDDTVYISMLSGGQDSTAMTLKMLENGYPIDYIVFCDTTLEHDEMYEYIDKLDAFFQRKYGKHITKLLPRLTFDEYIFKPRTKGDYIGKTRGTPSVVDMCFWRKEAKQATFERWAKKEGIFGEYIQYNGFVFGENTRLTNAPDYVVAPLQDLGWNENDVSNYLKENHMENKLYQHFSRTGCAVCPKNKIEDKYMLYKHYPKHWEYMKVTEQKLNNDVNKTGVYPRWHIKLFCHEMEALFKKKDNQQIFEFDFEPVQDCFCKI